MVWANLLVEFSAVPRASGGPTCGDLWAELIGSGAPDEGDAEGLNSVFPFVGGMIVLRVLGRSFYEILVLVRPRAVGSRLALSRVVSVF